MAFKVISKGMKLFDNMSNVYEKNGDNKKLTFKARKCPHRFYKVPINYAVTCRTEKGNIGIKTLTEITDLSRIIKSIESQNGKSAVLIKNSKPENKIIVLTPKETEGKFFIQKKKKKIKIVNNTPIQNRDLKPLFTETETKQNGKREPLLKRTVFNTDINNKASGKYGKFYL